MVISYHVRAPNHQSRSAAGVLVSDPKSRDIKVESYTLSFHGRLLIEGAEIALNYGQRCVISHLWSIGVLNGLVDTVS